MSAAPLWLLSARRGLGVAMTAAVVICALLLLAGGFLAAAGLLKASGSLAQGGPILCAAGLATLGWIVTAQNQRLLSRKQHTFNLLIQMRHSELFQARMSTVTKRRAPGTPIDADDLTKLLGSEGALSEDDRAFVRASNYLLNYFEFIASAVAMGDLDAELIRRTIRPHMRELAKKYAPYIQAEQEKNPRTFLELSRIAGRWD